MKMKIKILAVACILASIALLLIQYFYLKNTYELHRKTRLADIRMELLLMEKRINIDSLRLSWMKNVELKIGTATVEELIKHIRNSTDSFLITKNKDHISDNKSLTGHGVKYITMLSEVSVSFQTLAKNSFVLKDVPWFYNEYNGDSKQELTNHTLSSTLNGRNNEEVFCEMKTVSYFSVSNWFTPLLNQMILNIIGSTLILVFAITLFFVAIQNIIRQNKIAAIKTDFVNTITHEFNTPLAALHVALNALKSKSELINDPLSQTAVSTIDRQYKRLKDLIDHTTNHSLAEEEIKLKTEVVDNQLFLIDAVNDFKHTHHETTVSLTIQTAPVSLCIDGFHLTTAITNLLDNAVKYGNGQIEIKSFTDGDHYKISIKDNGVGIPEDKKKYIFEKFTRVETSNVKKVNGLGLGLYYAKNIITAHKGTIDIKNDDEQGTIFVISIPQS